MVDETVVNRLLQMIQALHLLIELIFLPILTCHNHC